MLDHAVGVNAEAGLAVRFFLQVGEDVHAGRVPPEEEGFVVLSRPFHEVEGLGVDFLVDGLHALAGQRAGVLDFAAGETVDDAAWCPFLFELGGLRIVRVLGFFLGVEVVKVAEEFVEAVVGWQHVVGVA